MGTKTLISAEAFDQLEPPDELRYELDEGELIEMVKPRYEPHNRIVRAFDRALTAYIGNNSIGEILSAENLYILGPTTKRAPDLSFLATERLKQIKPNEDIAGAPDLALEVLSPSDTAAAMRRKVKQYFAAGCRLVWLVYPESREIQVWESAAGPARVLGENDLLTGSDVLPGFSLNVRDLL